MPSIAGYARGWPGSWATFRKASWDLPVHAYQVALMGPTVHIQTFGALSCHHRDVTEQMLGVRNSSPFPV
jgi:hypothetical protein